MSKLDRMGGPPGHRKTNRKDHTDKIYSGWFCLHVAYVCSGHTFWATMCPTCHATKTQDVNNRKKWVRCKCSKNVI